MSQPTKGRRRRRVEGHRGDKRHLGEAEDVLDPRTQSHHRHVGPATERGHQRLIARHKAMRQRNIDVGDHEDGDADGHAISVAHRTESLI